MRGAVSQSCPPAPRSPAPRSSLPPKPPPPPPPHHPTVCPRVRSCTYGSRCAFAHGVSELASDSQPHMPPRLHGGDWRCTACQHVNVAARELCSRCASHRRFVEAPPPPGYVCRLCGVAGHWIHSCPSEANRAAILPSQPKPLGTPPFAPLPIPQGPSGLSASQLPAARPDGLGAAAPSGLDGGPMAQLPPPLQNQPSPLQNNPAALQNPAMLPGAGSSANGANAQLQALGAGGQRLSGALRLPPLRPFPSLRLSCPFLPVERRGLPTPAPHTPHPFSNPHSAAPTPPSHFLPPSALSRQVPTSAPRSGRACPTSPRSSGYAP